ncbi:hypothetical protein BIU97_01830 [Curtobacterium sp. MCBA15_009]|uniref:hypothetical protein n=1 Tax=Curtobacterium sp. MCBA15_009 TaxID=1898737 RepID=UPI0008DD3CCA|nr:hypothetical protein [Curtobacterium sp. MCBA15_009]OII14215.1 hypothetical protein BIU97_01830 [Curtobacterium sp. MCBA15_009]
MSDQQLVQEAPVEESPKKRWSGKKKLLVLGGVPFAGLGTIAAAAAVYFALAGVTGTGTNGDFSAKFQNMYPPTLDTSGLTVQPSGSASVDGSGKLALPALTVYPGESYTIQGDVVSSGSTGYISGVQLPGLPKNTTVTVVSGCGATVSPTSAAQVKLQITAPTTQTAGASWTLASDAGVKASPGTKPAGLTCTPWVAP